MNVLQKLARAFALLSVLSIAAWSLGCAENAGDNANGVEAGSPAGENNNEP